MDKISLITGVSRDMGLGYETARQLSALGHQVIITARDLEKVKSLARLARITAMPLDITQDGSVHQLVVDIEKQFGRIDVLINNAGAFFDQGGEPLSADIQFIKDAFDINLLGAWRMAKACVPLLKRSEAGRIVNVSSGAGSFTDPIFGLSHHPGNVPVYGITKLALNGLTVKLARELKDTAIKVNSVCPGFVATFPGTEKWGARPVADGARGIVWAATLPKDGPSGGFFRDGQPLSW
jgi:NAD(P)-dependent dehydrogenase (short-subunit alcohol dehydrogenase family)